MLIKKASKPTNAKSNKKREYISSVMTSDMWYENELKKQKEKEDELRKKEERKRIRELKRTEAKNMKEGRRNKRASVVKNMKTEPTDIKKITSLPWKIK